jgi:hypothetical protein
MLPLPLLPLTVLLLGTQFVGPALPLPPLPAITIEEPVILCQSNSYNNEQTLRKMNVDALTLGDLMGLIDPSVGLACDTSSGLEYDPTFGLPQPEENWKLNRT